MRPRSLAIGILSVVLLTGCFDFQDLGGYWEKGVADERMVGQWQHIDPSGTEGHIMAAEIKNNMVVAVDESEPEPLYLRTLRVDGHEFVMVTEDQADGMLVKYAFKDGDLTFYLLKEGVLEEAVKKAEVKGDLRDDGIPPQLEILDEAALDFVKRLADDPANWQTWGIYKRIKE